MFKTGDLVYCRDNSGVMAITQQGLVGSCGAAGYNSEPNPILRFISTNHKLPATPSCVDYKERYNDTIVQNTENDTYYFVKYDYLYAAKKCMCVHCGGIKGA